VAKVAVFRSNSTKRSTRPKLVHQFLIVLSGTDPLVWRRLQVPEKYSFWDLHVAIQAIANRRHPEHQLMLEWAGGSYDPDAFDPKEVVFDNPRKRWKKAFQR
jgi:hypothetical protein